MRRRLLVGGAAAYAVLTALLTLVPEDLQKQGRRLAAAAGLIARPTSMAHAAWQAGLTDRLVNGLMLVPLAALIVLARRGRPPGTAIAACVVLSAAIELTQHVAPVGRHGQVSDFLLNVAGAGVGATAAAAWTQARFGS